MSRTLLVASAALGLVVARPADAQPRPVETQPARFAMAKEYRAIQKSALDAQRKLLLSFADSMPERLYRDKATPAQRDFAQQMHHVVASAGFIAGRFLSTGPITGEDTAKVLNSRAGLKAFINERYDQITKILTDQSDADRDVQVRFFGQLIPRWQVWDELNQHAMWTVGQVVANFRKNGMAPPSFLFF